MICLKKTELGPDHNFEFAVGRRCWPNERISGKKGLLLRTGVERFGNQKPFFFIANGFRYINFFFFLIEGISRTKNQIDLAYGVGLDRASRNLCKTGETRKEKNRNQNVCK